MLDSSDTDMIDDETDLSGQRFGADQEKSGINVKNVDLLNNGGLNRALNRGAVECCGDLIAKGGLLALLAIRC